jgi:hypothetical protein
MYAARRLLLLGCAAAIAVAAPTAATAKPGLPTQARAVGSTIVVEGVVDKEAVLAQIDAYVDALLAPQIAAQEAAARADMSRPVSGRLGPAVSRRPAIHGSQHLKAEARRNRSCSYMYVRFDDTVSHPFFETSATVSGSSRTAWLGTCPFNANRVTLADQVCMDAVSFSVSVGGAGFSNSGGGCGSWSAAVSNNWQITHHYSGVKGSAGIGAIYRVRRSSTGTFQFGTVFYSPTANDSFLI